MEQIVLVEDDQDLRALFTLVLEQAGYTVLPVEVGQTALSVLQTCRCDLLVTDYHLPDIPGNLLISYARSVYPHLATLLMSGDPGAESLAALCQADAWFFKSDGVAEFLQAVGTACAHGAVTSEGASCAG